MRLLLEVEYPGDDCPTLREVEVASVASASPAELHAAVQLAAAEFYAHLQRLAEYRAGQPCTGGRKSH